MVNCFVRKCGHTSFTSGCRFFSLPKNTSELKKWRKLLSITIRELESIHDPKVCSCHFVNHDKENLPALRTSCTSSFDDSLLCKKRKKRNPLSDLANNMDCQSQNEFQDEAQLLKDENNSLQKQLVILTGEVEGCRLDQRDMTRIKDQNDSLQKQLVIVTSELESCRQDKRDLTRVKDTNNSLCKKIEVLKAQVKYSEQLKDVKRLKNQNMSDRKQIEMLTNQLITMSLRFELRFIEHSDEKVYLHTGLPSKKVFDILLKLLTSVPIKYYSGWVDILTH